MASPPFIPVFFLAFANDRDDRVAYLRNLPEEARHLREALEQAQTHGLCEVVVRENASVDDILRVFRDSKYRHRIAFFHYGGHANGYQLLLDSAEGKTVAAYAVGLAEFFGQQRELKAVFLNGCSTEPQVQDLLDKGISVVIATSQAIDDKVASEFATCFYQSMAAGGSIGTAYAEAMGVVKIHYGNETRNLYYAGAQPEVTDRWPWALYLRPGSEEMAQWNLPAVVDAPLFGLPPLPTLDLPNTPYRNLNWYRREDAEIFFGRGHDIRDLYNYITAVDSPPITLFYGQSGVGKSSLLEAGLLPRLEQSHTLAYLRRDQTKGLLGTLTSLPSPLRTSGDRLDWLQVEVQEGRPLLVVLDQVEEFRTRPNANLPQEMEELLTALQEVFGVPTRRPQGKLILSFRKEWLAEIEKQVMEANLPHAKVYLKRLDRQGIIDVIMGPTKAKRLYNKYHLTVEEGLAELIADDLLADQEAAVAPSLQILLTKLWDRAHTRSYEPVFDRVLYDQVREEGLGLDDFLNNQLLALRQLETVAVDSGLSLDLLAYHTTDQGTAEQHTIAEICDTYRHQETLVLRLLTHCQSLYLLTDPNQGTASSEPATRLLHDTLAPLVRARYDTSTAPGQRARRILESRVIHTDGDIDVPPNPLADADLAVVEVGRDGMRAWDEDEVDLIEFSRQAREKRKRQAQMVRQAFLALGLVIIAALSFALIQSIQTIVKDAETAQAIALRQANEAIQLIEVDPVESIYRSLEALPSPDQARPYVPQAEFALYQALRLNLEQEYLAVSPPPLIADQVTFADSQIAVGKNGLRLVSYDLAEVREIIPPDSHMNFRHVEWNHSKDAVLAWNDTVAQVGRLSGAPITAEFEQISTADEANPGTETIKCAQWRPNHNEIAICRGGTLWLWSYEDGIPQALYTPRENARSIWGMADILRTRTTYTTTATSTILDDLRWSPEGDKLLFWETMQTNYEIYITEYVTGYITETSNITVTSKTYPSIEKLETTAMLMLWDGHATRPLETFQNREIHDVRWSPDGQHWVVAFADATAAIGSIQDPTDVHSIQLQPGPPNTRYRVEFVNDNQFLTWKTGDGQCAQLWSVDDWSVDDNDAGIDDCSFGRELDNLQDVILSPDQSRLLTVLQSGTIRVWDFETGAPVVDLQGHTEHIDSTDWHDQSPYLATSSHDGTVRVWNIQTGQELVTLRGHKDTGQKGNPLWVHWHNDGQHLFTYGEDGTIRLWRIFDEHRNPMCMGMENCYGFSQRLSKTVTDTGETTLTIKSASWLNNTTILAADTNGKALRWRLPSSEAEGKAELDNPSSQPGNGSNVEWSPNGEWVFRYDIAGSGTLWNFSTGVSVTVAGPVRFAKWLDTSLILIVSRGEGQASIFSVDSTSADIPNLVVRDEEDITAAQARGDLLAIGYRDEVITVSDYKAGTVVFTLTHPLKSDSPLEIANLEWSPDGKHLLSMSTVSGNQYKATVWDIERRVPVKEWLDVRVAAFSPDGRYVAVAILGSFQVYDLQSNSDGSPLVLGHTDLINGIQWIEGKQWPNQEPIGKTVSGLLRLFRGQSWNLPSTRWLLLTWSGGDRTVRLWEWHRIDTPAVEIARFSSTANLQGYALNEQRSRLLTVDNNGDLRVWQSWLDDPEALRQVAQEIVDHRESSVTDSSLAASAE